MYKRQDYGDGTVLQVKSYDDENRKHTYKNAGTYNVKIDGICEAFSADNVTDSKDKITKLVQWLSLIHISKKTNNKILGGEKT